MFKTFVIFSILINHVSLYDYTFDKKITIYNILYLRSLIINTIIINYNKSDKLLYFRLKLYFCKPTIKKKLFVFKNRI